MQKPWVEVLGGGGDGGSAEGRTASRSAGALRLPDSRSSQQWHSPKHGLGTSIHRCRDIHPAHPCSDVLSLPSCGSVCQMERISTAPAPLTARALEGPQTGGRCPVFRMWEAPNAHSVFYRTPKGQAEMVALPSHWCVIRACSEVPILSRDVVPSARNLVAQKHSGQDGAAELTSQQAAFGVLASGLAAAAYIPIIAASGERTGSGLSVFSATDENWAKICNEQHSFKPE